MARPGSGETRRVVEDVAILFESQGMPRMAGRIFGWLLVSDEPCQTLGELGAAVGGSKASMSTMTRLLVRVKILARARRPGARSDCYFIRPDAWSAMFEEQLRFATAGRELADRGLSLLAGRPAEQRLRLAGFREGCAWLEREMPGFLEGWRRACAAAPAALPAARGPDGARRPRRA